MRSSTFNCCCSCFFFCFASFSSDQNNQLKFIPLGRNAIYLSFLLLAPSAHTPVCVSPPLLDFWQVNGTVGLLKLRSRCWLLASALPENKHYNFKASHCKKIHTSSLPWDSAGVLRPNNFQRPASLLLPFQLRRPLNNKFNELVGQLGKI